MRLLERRWGDPPHACQNGTRAHGLHANGGGGIGRAVGARQLSSPARRSRQQCRTQERRLHTTRERTHARWRIYTHRACSRHGERRSLPVHVLNELTNESSDICASAGGVGACRGGGSGTPAHRCAAQNGRTAGAWSGGSIPRKAPCGSVSRPPAPGAHARGRTRADADGRDDAGADTLCGAFAVLARSPPSARACSPHLQCCDSERRGSSALADRGERGERAVRGIPARPSSSRTYSSSGRRSHRPGVEVEAVNVF